MDQYYETATFIFNCTATGSGDLMIEWTCSDDSNCGVSSANIGNSSKLNNGSVTSTLVITGVTINLTVTCAVIQNLTCLSSGESADVEVRLPSIEKVLSTAQLIFIPVPTTHTVTQSETTLPGSEGENE